LKKKRQKKILVVRTDRVGDVVMITPMLRELRRTFPDAYIATLTNPNTADILIGNPHIDKIITDDLQGDSFDAVVSELKELKFTHGLLVMPTKRAAYQMFAAGVKKRIGVGRKIYELITFMKSVSRNKYIPLRHEADYCMDLARYIGVETNNLSPEIFLTAAEKEIALKTLVEIGAGKDDFKIIVHTGSGHSSSNWSEAKYFELIKKILNEHPDAKIILTAKEMSEKFRMQLLELKSAGIIFADKAKRLRELISIISCADMLIAPSTGPLHIAAALGIKTIGLYCHRRMNCAKHWGALGDKALNIEVSAEFCDSTCSSDKEICRFENGIDIGEVLSKI